MSSMKTMPVAPAAGERKSEIDVIGLDQGQISLMLATPVLVGALGRVVAGALTDRLGGRKMFTLVLLGSAPAVLLVAFAGVIKNFPLLIGAGFYLGTC